MTQDEWWMQRALVWADYAAQQGEIPVGAILVHNGQELAQGWNQTVIQCDPSAHAEIVAVRQAAKQLNNYRLLDTTLYVTLEPCVMCAGALVHARVKRVVFGAYDPKTGATGSRFDVLRDLRHNHHIDCLGGVLAESCGARLKDFFRHKRLL
ncbi:tRNA adenosine(34) deaminase TadA [Thioflexithrix psekupsensis]|uniref:tRNA-specific adenosine deaminase n=1 Tax=Thioflexithrix psekupsensis TaxID=1570016 RepID=A0A251XBW5_9GAMM|nr:tRNA adenosine(34) deaminase TadA [Thioflexithrix psekupsensis]OUD15637.1 tRNA adenosine(34) deaminase TadA [Thioflexithrix psekupsensis]